MEGKNYINGAFVDGASGERFESRSPASFDEVLGTFPLSSEKDVNDAVNAAQAAYDGWRHLSRIKRGEYLDEFTQLIKKDREEIARLMAKECGKGIVESRADVTEGIHMAQYVFGTVRMPHGDVVDSEIPEKDSFMRRKPKGVVAAITAWNFPFAVPLWLVCPSVVEGNTVILKPSRETACVGNVIAEYAHKAGFPPGVINIIHGSCGDLLVKHPDTHVVLFVGSNAVGAEIKRTVAGFDNKMAACEMGGKNALIVLDDASLDIAVNAAVISAFKTSGQRCTSASRFIVHEKVFTEFEKRFIEITKRIKIGDPLDESVFMGPVINQAATEKIAQYNELAKKEGAKVLLDGGRLMDNPYKKGYFMSPFVYRMQNNPKSRVLHEEVFGPHVAIIPVKDVDEAIEVHNDTGYGLTCAVITEDYRKARRIREDCEYGLGYVNLPTIGAEVHLPFGGVKKSGTGLPSGSTLIDVVTHRTAWTVNHAMEIKMAQGLTVKL
ncbi:MAG: aldehyde dehydrogenase family protein [Candidatus Jettenia sp.]|uniref:Aldehyde dehydrogenase n=1 Tax=Candidatus Jettenia caeni TaxID=247490 RepID=I3IQI9_9BACT|nr:aldehyde dehydrogenase family protein [Candidatus Jettenia sp. AMX1]MBC6928610.1 aldehyde dehydrogenase family protein [Candidatus Jettenia sp.]WKZ15295.1 MAG: aldehyde dehydrogenase family protein [Candidatus Jettenia caeni]KAA0249867.1 MAG: aldehyde dehydrogenase family protein [Candidatus Jettenia sp. AMX1]MCE7880605.1 aldehyde dehydrogenase family protein [Candidatus Jettenia sp. AMX1]MCQ3927243.1 aldehyde dehydrogenase family protein [Candidatus Jettenia sp.]